MPDASAHPRPRHPEWLRIRHSLGQRFLRTDTLLKQQGTETVCRSAACPNRAECWSAGTATFLILGTVCTRHCGFCNIPSGRPSPPDHDEPERIAGAVERMDLSYAVITSVTRDDLEDGGAGMFARSIRAIRARNARCRIEVLVPDFQGSERSLEIVLSEHPDILNHNIETVPSCYARVRPQADYMRSLELLRRAKRKNFIAKSGIMIGLGERHDEVLSVMRDLREAGCDILTIGQYLQPNRSALPVAEYHRPETFDLLREEGERLGFRKVLAGPLVRSSYHAESVYGRQ